MAIPEALLELIRRKAAQPAAGAVHALADRIRSIYGDAVLAILFYGSCLRSGDDRGGMVDLYAIVDRYRAAYGSRGLSVLNWLLPPNVFYLEVEGEGRVVRCKYAVLSMEDFERGVSGRWFHSYLWARFAQPAGMLWVRDEGAALQVVASLSDAVATFVARALPQAGPEFDASRLWSVGLGLTYRAELRSERPDRAASLLDAAPGYYEKVTAAVLARAPFPVQRLPGEGPASFRAEIPAALRLRNRVGWRVRAVQGKALSVLRLLKAAFTFHGGVNVGILSMAIGQRVGLAKNSLVDLGMSAIFHVLGKSCIPLRILNKPSAFDDEEWAVMRRHPVFGVKELLKLKGMDALTARIMLGAFEHHLTLDGSGYPRLEYPREVSLMGRIVSIADCYDALTSSRVYRRHADPPEISLRYLIERSGTLYDPVLVKLFVNSVGAYPIGRRTAGTGGWWRASP